MSASTTSWCVWDDGARRLDIVNDDVSTRNVAVYVPFKCLATTLHSSFLNYAGRTQEPSANDSLAAAFPFPC